VAFFQSSFISTLATAGTALLSLSFAFSVTTQEFLGSCIFLFVKHPYDVGDRVDIVGSEKLQMTVERISLLYTVFNRIDKMQVVQVPNIVLNNLWIENVTRSKAMKEVIDVNVAFDTSFEDIELLRQEMEKFVRNADNSRDFQPDLVIGVGGVGDLDKLTLKVAMKHKSNWHNEAVRATRRSKFMCALALALKKVPIHGPGGGADPVGAPSNPSYSVAISDAEASRNREKAELEKDAMRLVPLKRNGGNVSGDPTGGLASSPEMIAAQQLNTMNASTLGGADEWGYSRDDDTLSSHDQAADRLERMRSNELQKSTSARSGRRQAGATVPLDHYGSATPGIQVTQAGFDEEAQLESPNPYAQGGVFLPTTYQMIPPPGSQASLTRTSPQHPVAAAGQTPGAQPPHTPSSAARGARARGASVSRVQQENSSNNGTSNSNNPYAQR
jgi:hypothetical protein